MRLGIDIGISSTKVVAVDGGDIRCISLSDSHGYDANSIRDLLSSLDSLPEELSVTGVGSQSIGSDIMGVPVVHVDEFTANAQAARHIMPDSPCIAVSIGTGTSFVLVNEEGERHLGGSALGGGTLNGLIAGMLPGRTFAEFLSLAGEGNLANIDLQIGDVCETALPNLPMDTTASNLFKRSQNDHPSDIAAGIVNLVLQNIGVMANLAGTGLGIHDFVILGRLATLPGSHGIFSRLEQLYGIRILVPQDPAFQTAIGAAIWVRP